MLYLKLVLSALIVVFCYITSTKIAIRYREHADVLIQISNMFNHFRDGITLQKKSILEMLTYVQSQNKRVSAFCDSVTQIVMDEPEKPLAAVFECSVAVLGLPASIRRRLNDELRFIALSFERPMDTLCTEQIISSCKRIDEMHNEAMDKYKKNLFLYKRIGILSAVAFCMLLF